jgi:hypothetical protein
MFADEGTRDVSAHVAEFRHDDEPEDVEVSGNLASGAVGNEINDFRHEREEPWDVKEAEESESHCLERRDIARSLEKLAGKNDEQEEKESGDFEVVCVFDSQLAKVIERACDEQGGADHPDDLKVRELLVIEYRVEFPHSEKSQGAHEREECGFVTGKNDPEGDAPKCDRRAKTTKKNKFAFGHETGNAENPFGAMRWQAHGGRMRMGVLLSAAHAFDLRTMPLALQDTLLDPPRPRAFLTADFLPCGSFRGFFVGASFLQLGEKAKPGGPAIDGLGTGILDRDAFAGGKMFQRYSGGDFVDVLAAGATTAGELLLELCLSERERSQAGDFGGLELL